MRRFLPVVLLAAALARAEGVKLPPTVDFVLPNGLRVYLVPSAEVPLVSFEVRLTAGALADPEGKEGVAALLGRLLTKGAGARDAKAFLDAVGHVGASFAAYAGARWMTVECEFMKEHADLALELLADVLQRPHLDAEEFAKQRGQAIDSVRAAREEPEAVIATYWNGWLFRGQAFARPPSGDEESLARIRLADVRGHRERRLRPERAWMTVAGDFEPDAMRKAIEARLGGWQAAGKTVQPERVKVVAAKGNRVLLVDKPDALQTYFRFGNLGFDWSDPDYPARYLANTILGGRFTSRLSTALRIKGGLTYSAWSGFDDGRGGAFRVASFTRTLTSERAISLALEVYRKFLAEGMTQEELDSARRYVKGQFAPDEIESADQAASMILALESNGLSRDVVNRFFERLDALDLKEVNRVIAERFPSGDLTWVVIGQANVLEPLLRKYGEVTRVSIRGPGFAPR